MNSHARKTVVILLVALVLASPSALARDPAAPAQKLATRRMDEMTSREVQLYFQGGGNLVFVPFGPVSGHGSFITMGMHAHWAHALAVLMAEKANGLVYPPVTTCFSGATRSFRGSVSFPIHEQEAILVRISETLLSQGFKRVVLVAGTNPEDTGGLMAARRVFDQTEQPVWLLIASRLLAEPAVKAVYKGYPAAMGETQIDHAALKILGRGRAIPHADWARELKPDGEPDQPAEIAQDVSALRRWGSVGIRYFEEANHGNHGTVGLVHNGKSDIDLAVQVLEKSAEVALPALDRLQHYSDWIAKKPFKFVIPTERLPR